MCILHNPEGGGEEGQGERKWRKKEGEERICRREDEQRVGGTGSEEGQQRTTPFIWENKWDLLFYFFWEPAEE